MRMYVLTNSFICFSTIRKKTTLSWGKPLHERKCSNLAIGSARLKHYSHRDMDIHFPTKSNKLIKNLFPPGQEYIVVSGGRILFSSRNRLFFLDQRTACQPQPVSFWIRKLAGPLKARRSMHLFIMPSSVNWGAGRSSRSLGTSLPQTEQGGAHIGRHEMGGMYLKVWVLTA